MNRRSFVAALIGSSILANKNRSPALAQSDAMSGSDPMAAAVQLSTYESTTYIPALYSLYGYIHPDAEALVPRATVIGWYQNDFQPRGPQTAVATGLAWLDQWTWGVNGKTYANVAEVSYTQTFTDGSVDYEKVRLVYHDGAWRWFFGRDRSWVEEQNLRFSLKDHTPEAGEAPFGLNMVVSLEPTILQRLPETIFDAAFKTTYAITKRDDLTSYNTKLLPASRFGYKAVAPKSEFDLGSVEYGSIVMPGTEAENMDAIAFIQQNIPPVLFEGWNTIPASGPAWLRLTHLAVDVVGNSYELFLIADSTYLQIRMFSEESLAAICAALAGASGGL